MSLAAYKRKDADGVEVTLPRGVRVVLREFGTPQFWGEYMAAVAEQQTTLDDISPEQDKTATAWALARHIIVELDDITDPDEIFAIVSDKTYWELKKDIMAAARDRKCFLEEVEETAKKQ